MAVVRFNATGMFQEAQKNFKSEFLSQYTKENVAAVWKGISTYILELLNTYTGVEVPDLGTFTFTQVSYKDRKQIKVAPIFLVSKYISHMYRVKNSEPPKNLKKGVKIMKLNLTSVADKLNMNVQCVEVCVKEVLAALARLLQEGKCVDFPIPGVCVLHFKNGEVKTVFNPDFIRNLFPLVKIDYSKCEKSDCVPDERRNAVVTEAPLESKKVCFDFGQTTDPCPMEACPHDEKPSCGVVGVLGNIILPPKQPVGERPTPIEARYYDSLNKPAQNHCNIKHGVFFHNIPITQLRTQDQTEIALGEIQEYSTKIVCPLCASVMKNNIMYDYARRQREKAAMPDPECAHANYDDVEKALTEAQRKRDIEIARFNRCLEKLQYEKNKRFECEGTSYIFHARPDSAKNQEKIKAYRKELKEVIRQREEENRKLNEAKFRKEVEARERALRIMEEEKRKHECFRIQRMSEMMDGTEQFMLNKIRQANMKYCKELNDPNRWQEDPHMFFEYNDDEGATKKSKEEYVKNVEYNNAKAACDKERECLEREERIRNDLQVLEKIKQKCKNSSTNILRKQLIAENVKSWKESRCYKMERYDEESERLRQPENVILDQLCRIKKCSICKRQLNNTGESFIGGNGQYIV